MKLCKRIVKLCYFNAFNYYLSNSYLVLLPFIFSTFILLTIFLEKYSDILILILFLLLLILFTLKIYLIKKQTPRPSSSRIIAINIQRRLEYLMTEFDDFPSRNIQQDLELFQKSRVVSAPRILLEDETCSVCLDVLKSQQILMVLPCLHKFHSDCIENWLVIKPQCPVCKARVN